MENGGDQISSPAEDSHDIYQKVSAPEVHMPK